MGADIFLEEKMEGKTLFALKDGGFKNFSCIFSCIFSTKKGGAESFAEEKMKGPEVVLEKIEGLVLFLRVNIFDFQLCVPIRFAPSLKLGSVQSGN